MIARRRSLASRSSGSRLARELALERKGAALRQSLFVGDKAAILSMYVEAC
jgi:hypothetical protein